MRPDTASRVVRERSRYVKLPPELTNELVKYQIALDIPSFDATVELLIRQALSAVPDIAVIQHTRFQALAEARRWVKDRLAANLNEIQHQLMMSDQ